MRAARIHQYGGPEEWKIDEVEDPEPGSSEVLIDVHASSVNPVDCKMRAGTFRKVPGMKLPRSFGMDLSGVIRAIGPHVTGWKPGDEVVCSPGLAGRGTYAERIAINVSEIGRKPRNLTHQEAASLPLCFLTAWQALVDTANVRADQRVFIQAGAGGVGTIAIQIAKHLGAHVSTTCSARNADLVRSLGAETVIDYNTQRWDETLKDHNVVFDSLSLADAMRGRRILLKGGWIVGISVGLPERVKSVGPILGFLTTGIAIGWAITRGTLAGINTSFITRQPLGSQLDLMAGLCESGAIRPVIDTVYPLDKIADAHAQSDKGHVRGKIVIAIR